jgi:hypothetical protein
VDPALAGATHGETASVVDHGDFCGIAGRVDQYLPAKCSSGGLNDTNACAPLPTSDMIIASAAIFLLASGLDRYVVGRFQWTLR